MKKGRYETARKRRSNRSKSLSLVLSLVLVIGCVAGGTLAWLMDDTDEVVNTFTTSDIGVDLKEDDEVFKMVPGWTINKDPLVTVTANSEDCYLFVKVTESTTPDLDQYIKYAIADGWTELNSKTPDTDDDISFSWSANQVLTLPEVTEAMMESAETSAPTLSFTAYAVQQYKTNDTPFTAEDAWTLAQSLK